MSQTYLIRADGRQKLVVAVSSWTFAWYIWGCLPELAPGFAVVYTNRILVPNKG